MFPQLRNSSQASSVYNRWIGVFATAFITMVWCDLYYYASFEELARNNYGDWFEILCLYLAHVICSFTLLDLCSTCYVRDIYGLFFAASISGWILTGCFQTTFYDTLPVSVSWRGLCWYALIAVFIGLWLIRTLLHSTNKIWLFVFICCISGLTIASWSVWWMHGIGEPNATIPDITSVTILLFISTGILIISYFMLDKMYNVEDFMPTKIERAIVYLSILFALFVRIVQAGYLYMMLISWLPTMLASCYFLIYRYRKISIRVRDNAQVWHALALPHQLQLQSQAENNNNNDGNNNNNNNNNRDDQDGNHNETTNSDNKTESPNISQNNQLSLTQFNLARRDMISDLTDFKYEKSNLWVLLIIPSVGSITYTIIVNIQQHFTRKLPTATIINIAGIIIGFLLMFASVWRILLLNERVFLRNQYRSHIMEELELEIEMERAALMEQEQNNDEDVNDDAIKLETAS